MAAEYLLQEDGTSKITLEDDSGFLILESSTEETGWGQLLDSRRNRLIVVQ